MKQQFLKARTGTIRLTVYDKNTSLIPTSALITLYEPDGNSELQAQASASVNSSTGEMTYSLTTTHTAAHDLNYKAVWEYIVGGQTYYETQLFDVVKSILSIPITDDDLYDELESLRRANSQQQGTATSATANTIVDTAARKERDDFWKGGSCEILDGTGEGQRRDITGYTQSSSTFTVTPDWTTIPDTTSIYRCVLSYTNKILQSFKKIETMLYSKGKRDSLILESSQIELPLIYLTVHFIAIDFMDAEGDKWDLIQKSYFEKFQKAFDTLTLEYDADESGGIDDEEQTSNISSVDIFRA